MEQHWQSLVYVGILAYDCYLNASSHHPFFPPSLPYSLSVYPREGTADSLAMTRALGDFAYKRKPGLGMEEQMVRKGGREEGKVVACDNFVLTVSPSLPPSLPPLPQIIPLPDVHLHPRGPADEFLVLACDGVWDVLTNDEMAAFVEGHVNAAREGGRKVRREGGVVSVMVCGTCLPMTRWRFLWKST